MGPGMKKETAGNGNWDRMLGLLAEFKQKHGHCRVPANSASEPQLGRWVAAQRYKRKVGDLDDVQVKALDRLGFIWTPSDETWSRMFKALQAYKKRCGDCNVPEHWASNQSLANWVQSQRYRKKRGKLPSQRVAELESIGFTWAIYKAGEPKEPEPPKVTTEPVEPAGVRLYVIRQGMYVQCDVEGALPKELEAFARANRGELPPYIPMPAHATVFHLDEGLVRRSRVKWKGKGPVPAEIMKYLERNGTLPRYD